MPIVQVQRDTVWSKLLSDPDTIDRIRAITTETVYRYSPTLKTRVAVRDVEFVDSVGRFLTGLIPYVRDLVANDSRLSDITLEGVEERVSGLEPHLVDLESRLASLPNFDVRSYVLDPISQFLKHGRGIWKCATNSGKTYMAAALAAILGIRVLFVLPPQRTDLVTEVVEAFTALGHTDIKVVRASKLKTATIVVAAGATLHWRLKEDPEAFAAWSMQFDLLIYDECHELPRQMHEVLEKLVCRYRLFMSATPFRQREPVHNLYLMGYAGIVLAEIKNRQLVDAGYSAVPYIYLLQCTAGSVDPKLTHYTDIYKALVVHNSGRNQLIVDTTAFLYALDLVTVVFVEHKEHADQLSELLESRHGIRSIVYTGSQGKDERKKMFKQIGPDGHRVTFATRVLTTGKSTRKITALIDATAYKKQHIRTQMLGRGLREKESGTANQLIMVDIHDTGSMLAKAAKVRKSVWKADAAVRLHDGIPSLEVLKRLVTRQVRSAVR